MESNHNKGQEQKDHYNVLVNKQLFDKIEQDLGEITDFEIADNLPLIEIHYKSNGIPKVIYSNDKSMKSFLQCFLYFGEVFGQPKKYTQ